MQIAIIAVGNKMPSWVNDCCSDYLQRMPAEYQLKIIEVAAEKRGKNQSVQVARRRETERLLAAVPAGDWLIALDEQGRSLTTVQLARQFTQWQELAQNISFVIGGADGFDFNVARKGHNSWPNWRWSLSQLTYPHPLVRVILAEQLYRAWSVTIGHPYHRE
jgi:23S rRNA (pseudouridine1915-N3)-methyltransferase